jgi:lipoyl(octanoyl) transferase
MSADEAMLQRAIAQNVACLRWYTWEEPTLTLGYFQSHEEVPDGCSITWLRRHTGGSAIVHDQELTYALALPAGNPWQTNESWICRMHHMIADVLATFGVRANTVECGAEQKLGPLLCFAHQTPGDLLIDGNKVVGSAQRRPHRALLQHGSILLDRSRWAPSVPGINDLSGQPPIDARALAKAITQAFVQTTSWQLNEVSWTPADNQRIVAIMMEKYGNADWNYKR